VSTARTEDLVNLIATASWFIGIISGPMHVATALGLKCVVIMNFPEASQMVYPGLKPAKIIEMSWAYPQHVYLHQESESLTVKKLTALNLHKAFNGELYPFWSTKYCSLIHHKL
jgi:ADP-heptose:LPS heptosyltransferase